MSATDTTDGEIQKIIKYASDEVDEYIDLYKVIMLDDKIIGNYLLREYKDGFLLDMFYINEDYRNLGYGKEALSKILSSVSNTIYLYVYKNNSIAIELYKKNGFIIIDSTKERYLMRR